MDYQKLGKRIRSLRAQEEMTQDQLGEAAGYTGTHIGQIENARTVPSLEAVVNISNALHATPDELLMDSLESAELVYMHQIEKRLANMDLRTRIVACEMLEKMMDIIELSEHKYRGLSLSRPLKSPHSL